MTKSFEWIGMVRAILNEEGAPPREAASGDGSIYYGWEQGCVLRLGPDRVLTCSFTADLEDIRILISGDTTEDLSEDELCRVAREELRPMLDQHKRRFIQAGFQEAVESDHDRYAVVFTKKLEGSSPEEASQMMKWCRDSLAAV